MNDERLKILIYQYIFFKDSRVSDELVKARDRVLSVHCDKEDICNYLYAVARSDMFNEVFSDLSNLLK